MRTVTIYMRSPTLRYNTRIRLNYYQKRIIQMYFIPCLCSISRDGTYISYYITVTKSYNKFYYENNTVWTLYFLIACTVTITICTLGICVLRSKNKTIIRRLNSRLDWHIGYFSIKKYQLSPYICLTQWTNCIISGCFMAMNTDDECGYVYKTQDKSSNMQKKQTTHHSVIDSYGFVRFYHLNDFGQNCTTVRHILDIQY